MSKLTIVMYHYVRNLKDTRYPEIKGLDIEEFEGQIKYLLKHYNIIRMENVIEYLETGKRYPEKSVLLTFDDGYKDHYTYVFPILMKYNLQGSFFIPIKCFKEKRVLDVNKIHFILTSEKNKRKLVDDIFILLDSFRKEFNLMSNEYYYNKLAINSRFDTKEVIFIKRLLQVELEEKLRNKMTEILFEKYVNVSEKAFWEELYLTKEQVQTMQKCGMHFGSHSYDHYWLASLSKEEQKNQIGLSLEGLKEMGIYNNKWSICYPYGSYNNETLEVLKELGCSIAFTTKVDVDSVSENNKYHLSRLDTNDLPKYQDAEINKYYEKG